MFALACILLYIVGAFSWIGISKFIGIMSPQLVRRVHLLRFLFWPLDALFILLLLAAAGAVVLVLSPFVGFLAVVDEIQD